MLVCNLVLDLLGKQLTILASKLHFLKVTLVNAYPLDLSCCYIIRGAF